MIVHERMTESVYNSKISGFVMISVVLVLRYKLFLNVENNTYF